MRTDAFVLGLRILIFILCMMNSTAASERGLPITGWVFFGSGIFTLYTIFKAGPPR